MTQERAVLDVLEGAVPTVEAGTRVIVAATLLDIPRRDVILIANSVDGKLEYVTKAKKWIAFAGYPILRKMLDPSPMSMYRFLFEPCENASLLLDPVPSEVGLAGVLDSFKKTRFGYALVKSPDSFGLVTLTSLLALYGDVISTTLRVGDVASRSVFTLPREASLVEAVRGMFEHSQRRVRLAGTNSFVSDREVLSFILSPRRLAAGRESPNKILHATLGEVMPLKAIEVEEELSVNEAARVIRPGSGKCLTVGPNGSVVTPWDLVMKPFERHELVMGA